MLDEYRSQIIKYGAVLLAAIAVGGAYFALRPSNEVKDVKQAAARPAPISVQSSSSEKVGVHVAGGVRRPGVYWLRQGSRVTDAIAKAGGSVGRADLSALNLAAKVEDGRQVLVPLCNGESTGTTANGAVQNGGGSGTSGSTAALGGGGKQLLNLNNATPEQFEQLDGVGPATARKIYDYRQEHGGFSRIDELGEIAGIGEKKLAALRAQVTV